MDRRRRRREKKKRYIHYYQTRVILQRHYCTTKVPDTTSLGKQSRNRTTCKEIQESRNNDTGHYLLYPSSIIHPSSFLTLVRCHVLYNPFYLWPHGTGTFSPDPLQRLTCSSSSTRYEGIGTAHDARNSTCSCSPYPPTSVPRYHRMYVLYVGCAELHIAMSLYCVVPCRTVCCFMGYAMHIPKHDRHASLSSSQVNSGKTHVLRGLGTRKMRRNSIPHYIIPPQNISIDHPSYRITHTYVQYIHILRTYSNSTFTGRTAVPEGVFQFHLSF